MNSISDRGVCPLDGAAIALGAITWLLFHVARRLGKVAV